LIEIVNDPLIALIKSKIEDYKSSIELFLAEGGATTHEDYVKLTGKYEAFRLLEEDLSEIEKKYIES
tara:strand:- start:2850 stop:3050 length:201 start_codon:yes stop_codon:yes gene_type:complete